MRLLERESQLRALGDALTQVRNSGGCVALVYGEAGSGKTSLVEQFITNHKATWRVLAGSCDLLFTPRPLGPLHDIAAQTKGRVQELLDSGADRARLFSACLNEFGDGPTILIVEDTHWADEATLDLLKYLGRRIRQTHALMLLTYRDDELGIDHPLRSLIGDLASSQAVYRISIPPLSRDAVRQLAERKKVDGDELHRLTNGNAFYVTEVLAGEGGIPPTVRDAVLARTARLSTSARTLLEAAAVIGLRSEPWLLSAIAGQDVRSLDECTSRGILQPHGTYYSFRHELARQTILESIPAGRRADLHLATLAELKEAPSTRDDLTRLAHHAQGAGDAQAVLHYAPPAAQQAAKAGAHRQAAALYEAALNFSAALPLLEQARMLEAYADQLAFLERSMALVRVHQQIIEKYHALGDGPREAKNLALLGRDYYGLGYGAESTVALQAAVAIAQALPSSAETAIVYGFQSRWLAEIAHDSAKSVAVGEKSIAMAELCQDMEVLAWACQHVGNTMLNNLGDERGRELLERGLAIGREHELDYVVGLCLNGEAVAAVYSYEFGEAARLLPECIAFATAHDDDYMLVVAQSLQAEIDFWQGAWRAAADLFENIHQASGSEFAWRAQASYILSRIGIRRGDADAQAQLQTLLHLCEQSHLYEMFYYTHAAMAEAAWLGDDYQHVPDRVRTAYDVSAQQHIIWLTGELAFWRWRAGDEFDPPEWIAKPYALQIAGDWKGAAREWEQHGCPYEQGMALMDGDEAAQLAALKIFEPLGARPIIEKLKRKMRAEGVRGIPRGPRPSTRGNRFGLTGRETEVLGCLVKGSSNPAIARELSLSARTVEHHIGAMLQKTGAQSRSELIALALRENLIVIK